MTFLTEGRAREAARVSSRQFAEAELRRFATTTPMNARFDIFLSHSYLDAQIILGVKNLLEATGARVYVDWIEDHQLDRDKISARTAAILRSRMRNCKSLIFATSSSSSSSKWMPWELGYFDGYRPGHVAILPLVKVSGARFEGQEYLGLYPYVEDIPFSTGPTRLGIYVSDTRAVSADQFSVHPVPATG